MDNFTRAILNARYLRIPHRHYENLLTYKSGKRSEYAVTYIRLHTALLRDYDFTALPDVSKAQFLCLCLLAVQRDNNLPHDASWLQLQMGLKEPPDLSLLINAGFLETVYVNARTGEESTAPFEEPKRSFFVEKSDQVWIPAEFTGEKPSFSEYSKAGTSDETANVSSDETASVAANASSDVSPDDCSEGKGREGNSTTLNPREGKGTPTAPTQPAPPRKRGRPRKHPLPDASTPRMSTHAPTADPKPQQPKAPPNDAMRAATWESILWADVEAGRTQIDHITLNGMDGVTLLQLEAIKENLRDRLQAKNENYGRST